MNNEGKKNLKESFFKQENYLTVQENIYSIKEEYTGIKNIQEFLNQYAKNQYKVVIHAVNEIKFGYYNLQADNNFTFADDKAIEEAYILQMRLFNQNEEILIKQDNDDIDNNTYIARIIKDSKEKKEQKQLVQVIDDASILFGERINDSKIKDGFAHLVESGRKISLIIPTNEQAKAYALVTRSYIDFDEKTGQAGIGYYRYLDIRPQVK